MSTAVRQRTSIRFRARSYTAFVLAPKPPIADWLAELDEGLSRSAGFFAGRPIVLDLSALSMTQPDLMALIADLHTREIRIWGIEGGDPSILGLGLPPPMKSGHSAGSIEIRPARSCQKVPPEKTPEPERQATSLLLNEPVRSGQSVAFPDGDLTIIGSVGSGAELVAGGSIHVYGTLRGRALAGSRGNAGARIFCTKNEAELLAIGGVYQAAEDMPASLRNRSIQVSLEGAWLKVSGLD